MPKNNLKTSNSSKNFRNIYNLRFLHCAEDELSLHNAAVASDYWVKVFEVKLRILFDVQQPKEYDLTEKNTVFERKNNY